MIGVHNVSGRPSLSSLPMGSQPVSIWPPSADTCVNMHGESCSGVRMVPATLTEVKVMAFDRLPVRKQVLQKTTYVFSLKASSGYCVAIAHHFIL